MSSIISYQLPLLPDQEILHPLAFHLLAWICRLYHALVFIIKVAGIFNARASDHKAVNGVGPLVEKDFALSVRDGRLFTQVARLTRKANVRTCLILEGTSEQYPRLAIPRPAFQGALITVMLVFGLPVLRSATPEETADLILYAAHQLQRRDVRQPRRRGFRAGGITRHQLLLLQAIPEVGAKKAEWLLTAFGSPAGVAEATVESLEAVQGIGQHSAQRIYSVLHGTER